MGNTDADKDKMNTEFDSTSEVFRRFWKIGAPRPVQGDAFAWMGTESDLRDAERRKRANNGRKPVNVGAGNFSAEAGDSIKVAMSELGKPITNTDADAGGNSPLGDQAEGQE